MSHIRRRSAGVRFEVKTLQDVSATLVTRLTGAGSRTLRVGIFEGSGEGQTVTAEGGAKGTPIAQYMFFHEYGTSHGLPEKRWFRGALDENQKKYADLMSAEAKSIAAGSTTPDHALTRIGVEMANDLKLSITDHDLIDTGAARNAVAFDVKESLLGRIRARRAK